jgi:hypothetical protein
LNFRTLFHQRKSFSLNHFYPWGLAARLQIATAKGDDMNFLQNLFQSPSRDNGRNGLQKSSTPPDSNKAESKLLRAAPANAKSRELTQDQLAETLRWLSLY